MKKIILFLIIASTVALTILAAVSFDFFNFNFSPPATSGSDPFTRVRVKPFLSQEEDYAENIQKGDTYAKKGYTTLAVQAYTLANKTFPGEALPYRKIGAVYYDNRAYEKAAENLRLSLQINDQDEDTLMLLSKTLIKMQRSSEAKELLVSLSENRPKLQLQLAFLLVGAGDFSAAKNLFSALAARTEKENEPESAEKNIANRFLNSFANYEVSRGAPTIYLQTLLAKNLAETENYDLAISLLQKVVTEKNSYRDAWILLGYSYLNNDKALDAAAALQEALRLAPEKTETRYLLALAKMRGGKLDEAIENMEIALQNDFKPREEALSKLGEMYLQAEKYTDAARIYDELLKEKPEDINLFIKPIWIYLDHLSNIPAALERANQAQSNHPDSAMSYNLLGWVKTKQGEFTEAKINFDRALAINPNLEAVYLNLGIWHEKQNQLEEAKQNYKIAYEKGDGNSIANLAAIHYNNLIRNPSQ